MDDLTALIQREVPSQQTSLSRIYNLAKEFDLP